MGNKLLVIKDGLAFDVSGLVESYQWAGRNDSAARSLKVTFLDEESGQSGRAGIEIEKGRQCIFLRDYKELFRGMFMRQEQNSGKKMTLTAFDNGIYLANNKDSFNYTDKSASFIFTDVCGRFNIPYERVDDTGYVIEELPKPSTTGYDAICDALDITYEATGRRYNVRCEGGKLSLIRRRDNVIQWVIASGTNLSAYSYSKSLEKIKTRLKLFGKENELLAQKINSELESDIGIFQEIISADNEFSPGKLDELAESILREKNALETSLTIDAPGHVEITAGLCVYVIIPHLGLEQSFYVESDSHTFKDGLHTMRLTLAGIDKLDIEDGRG